MFSKQLKGILYAGYVCLVFSDGDKLVCISMISKCPSERDVNLATRSNYLGV